VTRIRPATLGDVAALAGLNGQLGYLTSEGELSERLAPILEHDEHAVLVATDGTQPIGWIHLAIEHRLEEARAAVVRGLIVDEAHRSAGVGRDLLRAGEEWARDCGCAEIVVRTRVTRERAHRFYERQGFERVKTSHVFSKRVG
jgi:GNAT superfamily N-acetyltransferase